MTADDPLHYAAMIERNFIPVSREVPRAINSPRDAASVQAHGEAARCRTTTDDRCRHVGAHRGTCLIGEERLRWDAPTRCELGPPDYGLRAGRNVVRWHALDAQDFYCLAFQAADADGVLFHALLKNACIPHRIGVNLIQA